MKMRSLRKRIHNYKRKSIRRNKVHSNPLSTLVNRARKMFRGSKIRNNQPNLVNPNSRITNNLQTYILNLKELNKINIHNINKIIIHNSNNM